jgi:hypothetical protein
MAGSKVQRLHSATAALLTAAVIFSCSASADEAPRLIKVRLRRGYLEADGRYEDYERTTSQAGGYEREFLQIRPKLGLSFDGSIYHSNLLDYYLSMELGLNSEYERIITSSASVPDRERSDASPLQFYRGNVLVLKDKKLSGALFGSFNLIRRDNDFFTRETLYLRETGARLSYAGDVLPWVLTAKRTEEEETESPAPRSSMRDELNFNTSNQRGAQGRTRLNYHFQDFINNDFNVDPYSGIRNSLRLNDVSYLNSEDLKLSSYVYYNDIESTTVPSTTFSLREVLNARHTSSLSSSYSYNYSTRDSGSTESISHDAEASLRHQLYDSLTSTISADILDTSQTSQDTFQRGFTLRENYSKHVGDSTMLNLGLMVRRHDEERQASGGDTIQINNEPHTLTTGIPTFLNQPNVIASSISVTDVIGTTLYREFFDYLVIQRNSITEIQRVVGGDIPNGGAVLVSYSAANPGGGSFTTEHNQYRFRYYLLNQLLSVYGHIMMIEHNGGEQFTLEDVDERVIGLESTWKWLNVGMEYQDYGSSLLSYETYRLFENISVPLSWRSMLNLSASQAWIYYPETNEDYKRYFHNMVYRNQLTRRLSFNIGGSVYIQRSENNESLDRDLLAANTRLNYKVGKTSISATCEYRYEKFRDETIAEQTAYLRVRRNF